MQQILTYIILVPIIVWSTFQQALIANANQVEETMMLAVYETQKEASIQGRYTEELYKQTRDYLVNNHNYDRDEIEITGTESRTPRGEEITVQISIPAPVTTVIDMFPFGDDDPYVIERSIVSEYIP